MSGEIMTEVSAIVPGERAGGEHGREYRGSYRRPAQVALQSEAAYATAFGIQTSPDGTNWTSIFSTTTGTGPVRLLAVCRSR